MVVLTREKVSETKNLKIYKELNSFKKKKIDFLNRVQYFEAWVCLLKKIYIYIFPVYQRTNFKC